MGSNRAICGLTRMMPEETAPVNRYYRPVLRQATVRRRKRPRAATFPTTKHRQIGSFTSVFSAYYKRLAARNRALAHHERSFPQRHLGVLQSNLRDHRGDARRKEQMLRLRREMDMHSHDRCIFSGENHHRPWNGLSLQNLMVDSWVRAGWRGSLDGRTVASQGKEGCSECEC